MNCSNQASLCSTIFWSLPKLMSIESVITTLYLIFCVLLSFSFAHSSVGKESACNAGDPGSIPGLGRSAGEGIGCPFQYSCASLVAQLVKNLLQCRRPGFDPWVGKIPWRRERLPTLVFWPGEFHGLCSPWGHKELDMTEPLHFHFSLPCIGEGNGNPLQCSCLENPRDGGA